MNKALQTAIRIIFLIMFAILLVKGKIQIWMAVFIAGFIASLFLGRIFCGWVCPINTLMHGVTWLKKRLRLKSFNLPQCFTKPWVRYLFLGLFFAVFIFTMVTGKKLPVLPALLALGVFLTFFFPEELWHRYLCPYGTILSIPAAKTGHVMRVEPDLCNNCGACERVCPAGAFEKTETHHRIIQNSCLICGECSDRCRQNAIAYK